MPPHPIAAYAAINALGSSVEDMLQALRQGRSGLRSCNLGDERTACGVVDVLEPLPASLHEYECRQSRLAAALAAAIAPPVRAAVQRHGRERVGLVVGTSTGGVAETERHWSRLMAGDEPREFSLAKQHDMAATLHVLRSITGVQGPGWVVSTACSSSGKAFASARRLLQAGVLDAVLVGGVDTLCDLTLHGFHALELLAAEPCRPFSSVRCGISLGEGGALLLIERRGDHAVCLEGVGETSDAYHMTAPQPEGTGAYAAMALALDQASVQTDQVDCVFAHGTATLQNDAAEAAAVRRLLGAGARVVATKGYTGHLLGAAGATQAVLAILAITHGFVPASLGSEPIDANVSLTLDTAPRPCALRHVLSNSFAFGGSNVSVLFGAAP